MAEGGGGGGGDGCEGPPEPSPPQVINAAHELKWRI